MWSKIPMSSRLGRRKLSVFADEGTWRCVEPSASTGGFLVGRFAVRIRWRLWILLLVAVQAAGCTGTVQGLKKRGVEVDVDRGEVKRVYRF